VICQEFIDSPKSQLSKRRRKQVRMNINKQRRGQRLLYRAIDLVRR